jgi:hypothetical protein
VRAIARVGVHIPATHIPGPPSPTSHLMPATQSPLPSQVEGQAATLPLHLYGEQSARVLTQVPAPLHCMLARIISISQVRTGLHVPAGSLAPAGTGAQLPALPAIAHELQLPHEATAQHTPSVQ